MTPTEIKIILMRKGISQADIARKLNVTRALVNALVTGAYFNHMYGKSKVNQRSRSYSVMVELSKLTGKPIADLWPQMKTCKTV